MVLSQLEPNIPTGWNTCSAIINCETSSKLFKHKLVWFPHQKKKSTKTLLHRSAVSIRCIKVRTALRTVLGRVSPTIINLNLQWPSEICAEAWVMSVNQAKGEIDYRKNIPGKQEELGIFIPYPPLEIWSFILRTECFECSDICLWVLLDASSLGIGIIMHL